LQHKIELLVGHPTCNNHDNAARLIASDISAINCIYPDTPSAILVSDGSFTEANKDLRTLEACVKGADSSNINMFVCPYEGYKERAIAGKGSAIKMIFDEMENSEVKELFLLDGDLKNDFTPWFKTYKMILNDHYKSHPAKEAFITASYARHFVDASITRNIVGPLTTLLGTYVPGGISGDIVLTSGAVALERKAEWTEARYKYGTDIATTFDNMANGTMIYEAYLGAKLHDITDDAKLSVMPGEVIGSALERILFYEKLDGRVSKLLMDDSYILKEPIQYDSNKTGISFINPGYTDSFVLKLKRETLANKYPDFSKALEKVLTTESFTRVDNSHKRLVTSIKSGSETPLFLNITPNIWCNLIHQSILYLLTTEDIDTSKRALNYLYTAAFLETCSMRLYELGLSTIGAIEKAQNHLGVDDAIAKEFYTKRVDAASAKLAHDFFIGRRAALERRII
jgi:hypothetical protein